MRFAISNRQAQQRTCRESGLWQHRQFCRFRSQEVPEQSRFVCEREVQFAGFSNPSLYLFGTGPRSVIGFHGETEPSFVAKNRL